MDIIIVRLTEQKLNLVTAKSGKHGGVFPGEESVADVCALLLNMNIRVLDLFYEFFFRDTYGDKVSDIIDDANDAAELFIQSALHSHKRNREEPIKGIGLCLYCLEEVPDNRRWCGPDCRDEWEKEKSRP